jgi:hypothetical protein
MMQEIIVSVQPIQEIVDKIVQEQKVLSVLVLVRLLVDLPSHQRMVVAPVVEKEHTVPVEKPAPQVIVVQMDVVGVIVEINVLMEMVILVNYTKEKKPCTI